MEDSSGRRQACAADGRCCARGGPVSRRLESVHQGQGQGWRHMRDMRHWPSEPTDTQVIVLGHILVSTSLCLAILGWLSLRRHETYIRGRSSPHDMTHVLCGRGWVRLTALACWLTFTVYKYCGCVSSWDVVSDGHLATPTWLAVHDRTATVTTVHNIQRLEHLRSLPWPSSGPCIRWRGPGTGDWPLPNL